MAAAVARTAATAGAVALVVVVAVALGATGAAAEARAESETRTLAREEALAALAGVLLDPAAPLPWRQEPLPSWSLPDLSNSMCAKNIAEMWNAAKDGLQNPWALKMIDASTKIPDGLMFGNVIHLGNFDECLSVREGAGGSSFNGKHCLVTLTMTMKSRAFPMSASDWEFLIHGVEAGQMLPTSRAQRADADAVSVSVQLAWCVPSSCQPEDLEWLAMKGLGDVADRYGIVLNATVDSSHCHEHEAIKLRGIDIFAICLLGFFVACVLLSTIYDIITEKRANRPMLLLAFSMYSNWPKLLTVNTGQDQLTCLNGIRTISIGWVVLGHVYFINATMPAINAYDFLPDFIANVERLTIMNATVSVDTFFMLSGLLLSFLFLKEVEKTNRFNIIKFYVHRYVRLTPPLAILILLTVTIFNYMGTGPLWNSRHDTIKAECEENWWTNLLYVNNYVNPERMCIGQTWYLAVDMQLHWLSPLVLLPLWKFPKRYALFWIYFLIAFGWATPFAIVYLMELYPGTYVGTEQQQADSMKYYYFPTHTRFVPWLLGVLLGYILRECRKKKPEIHPVVNACGWILSTVLMTGTLNAAYPFQQTSWTYNRIEAAFWLSLFRPLWAIGVGWIIFACDQGYGGLVDKILSWNFFQPLARLSYGVYLTHFTILYLFAGVVQSPVYLADVNLIPQFFGVLIMSVAWAIPLTLLFESPIILIEKAVMGGGRRPPPAANKEQDKKSLEDESQLSNGRPNV